MALYMALAIVLDIVTSTATGLDMTQGMEADPMTVMSLAMVNT